MASVMAFFTQITPGVGFTVTTVSTTPTYASKVCVPTGSQAATRGLTARWRGNEYILGLSVAMECVQGT